MGTLETEVQVTVHCWDCCRLPFYNLLSLRRVEERVLKVEDWIALALSSQVLVEVDHRVASSVSPYSLLNSLPDVNRLLSLIWVLRNLNDLR